MLARSQKHAIFKHVKLISIKTIKKEITSLKIKIITNEKKIAKIKEAIEKAQESTQATTNEVTDQPTTNAETTKPIDHFTVAENT